jgi:hypothetical protein
MATSGIDMYTASITHRLFNIISTALKNALGVLGWRVFLKIIQRFNVLRPDGDLIS